MKKPEEAIKNIVKYRKLSDLQRDIETLNGKRELTPDHELIYKERRQSPAEEHSVHGGAVRREAALKASLVAVEPDALVVSGHCPGG